MELKDRIDLFVAKADEISAKHWDATHFPPPKHHADYISSKWCRIVTTSMEARSVYAFICLEDGQTKTLGILKKGDVHKAAGWKAPAKHARGNVFDDDFEKYLTRYGPVYLK